MAQLFAEVNPETGLFIGDVIKDAQPLLNSGEPDPAYVATPCPGGFQWPRWDADAFAWEEGGTKPEPQEPTEATPSLVTPEAFAALESAVNGILDALEASL